ncbi:MAG: KamA family radical SAM protein [Desulfonatronovibrio sp.]
MTSNTRFTASAHSVDTDVSDANSNAAAINDHFHSLRSINWREIPWQQELKNNITSIEKLGRYLPLTSKERDELTEVAGLHPLNIPRYYLSLIDPDNPADPIRRLCVPDPAEMVIAGNMGATTADPYGDDLYNKGNGILHKYSYTALVVASEYCAMYCRHCFRKRMVGLPNEQTVKNFQEAAGYISEHPEITNVVVSGGDPFLLPTAALKKMLNSLRDIPHLNYVRIGSRAPVTYPVRFFDNELMDFLQEFNKQKTLFVPTHFNHAREITPESTEAVMRIRQAGITVNNQAVLLRGVNDTVEDLVNLMNGLMRIGVNPYYLYQCMPVARVRHHFQVPLKEGVDLVDQARQRFDGYAKRFKFIIGHEIGKIEICGRINDKIILKQIHAPAENQAQASRIMVRKLTENGAWLEDLPEAEI